MQILYCVAKQFCWRAIVLYFVMQLSTLLTNFVPFNFIVKIKNSIKFVLLGYLYGKLLSTYVLSFKCILDACFKYVKIINVT